MIPDEELYDEDETIEQDIVEDDEAVEEEEDEFEGEEFVPEGPSKPKSDVYTLMLILSFMLFLSGIIVAGRELHEDYDVEFFGMFEKGGPAAEQPPGPSTEPPPDPVTSE